MYELDCLGDMCPIPIMKLKQCKQIKEKGGQLKLVTDHSCVVESISGYCKKQKLQIHIEEPMNGIWELYKTSKARQQILLLTMDMKYFTISSMT